MVILNPCPYAFFCNKYFSIQMFITNYKRGWKLIVNVRIYVEVYAHLDDEVCSIVFYTVRRKSPHKNCRKNHQSTHNRKQWVSSPFIIILKCHFSHKKITMNIYFVSWESSTSEGMLSSVVVELWRESFLAAAASFLALRLLYLSSVRDFALKMET